MQSHAPRTPSSVAATALRAGTAARVDLQAYLRARRGEGGSPWSDWAGLALVLGFAWVAVANMGQRAWLDRLRKRCLAHLARFCDALAHPELPELDSQAFARAVERLAPALEQDRRGVDLQGREVLKLMVPLLTALRAEARPAAPDRVS